MENSPFFQKVWRFNAMIIALAGLLATIVLSVVLAVMAKDFYERITRDVQAHDVVNTSTTEDIKEKLELGHPELIAQTGYLHFPLVSRQGYDLSYSKEKTATSTRNLLFFNTVDGSSHWLLNSHKYLLLSQELGVKHGDEEVITGLLYEVIKADTNGDERLTHKDKTTLAVSKPDGTQYNELISDVSRVIDVEKHNGTAYIVYQKDEKRYLTTLNMRDLLLIKTSEVVLPELPKK